MTKNRLWVFRKIVSGELLVLFVKHFEKLILQVAPVVLVAI